MKKILFVLLFIPFLVKSQPYTPTAPPANYTGINFQIYYRGMILDRLTIPAFNATPSIRTGQFNGAGAIGVDSVANRIYFYSGGIWREMSQGGAPAGSYGNLQLNRNTTFATPATDSLKYTTTAGLNIKNIETNLGLGVGTTSIDSKAIADFVSTTKGILIPRLTTTQQNAITSPTAGLLIWNSDTASLFQYTGSVWQNVHGGGGGGGSGTVTTVSRTNNLWISANVTNPTTTPDIAIGVDSAGMSTYFLRRKDSLTSTNPLGYVTKKILADTSAAIRSIIGTPSQWVTTGSDIYYNTGSVAIGATSVAASAKLDLVSTTKGFLAPRMNTTQQDAISSPATGLLIFNTDTAKFRFYNGAAWTTIGGTGGGGGSGTVTNVATTGPITGGPISSTGTIGLDTASGKWRSENYLITQFYKQSGNIFGTVGRYSIGFKDSTHFDFKTKDSVRMRLWANGNLSVGDTVDSGHRLRVFGGFTIITGSDSTQDMYYRNAAGTFTPLRLGPEGYVIKRVSGQIAWAPDAGGISQATLNDSMVVVRDSIAALRADIGNGGVNDFGKLRYKIGDSQAPAAGDSIIVHTAWTGRFIKFYRNGELQSDSLTADGYELGHDTIYAHPPFYAGERIWIEDYPATDWTYRKSENMDVDAIAFISAAGISNSTQKTAINQLVLDLKAASLWTNMKAAYPVVGGTSTTHKYNLKDPRDLDAAYRLTFSGTITHDANGVTGNGTDGFADTHLNDNTVLQLNAVTIGAYSRTSNNTGFAMGCLGITNDGIYMADRNSMISRFHDQQDLTSAETPTRLLVQTRTASNSSKQYRDGSQIGVSTTASANKANYSIYLMAINNNGTTSGYSSKNYAFFFIYDGGMTATDITNLTNAVNTFETTLGRNL